MRKDIDNRYYSRCVCSNQQLYIVRDTSLNVCLSHTIACWLSLFLILSKYSVEYDCKKEANQLSLRACELDDTKA